MQHTEIIGYFNLWEIQGAGWVCITDHQTMDIRHSNITEGFQEDGLLVIFGMEYETLDGDFLIFGPFEEIQTSLSARELLETVNKNRGAAIAAHPFRKGRSVSEYIAKERLCCLIEKVNGRNSDEENKKSEKWIKNYKLKGVGGSDAHTLEELGKIKTEIIGHVTCRNSFIQTINENAVRLLSSCSAVSRVFNASHLKDNFFI